VQVVKKKPTDEQLKTKHGEMTELSNKIMDAIEKMTVKAKLGAEKDLKDLVDALTKFSSGDKVLKGVAKSQEEAITGIKNAGEALMAEHKKQVAPTGKYDYEKLKELANTLVTKCESYWSTAELKGKNSEKTFKKMCHW